MKPLLILILKEKELYVYAEGKWTFKQLLVHVIDTERIFNYRALRFARNDSTELQGFDHDFYNENVAANSQELQELIDRASQSWANGTYDHPTWFFGSTTEVPRWAGYSIGYELVKNYLENNSGTQPSDLVDEPANSFLP